MLMNACILLNILFKKILYHFFLQEVEVRNTEKKKKDD